MNLINVVMVVLAWCTFNVAAYPSVMRKHQKRNRSKSMLGNNILKQKYCFDNQACDHGYTCDMFTHKCSQEKCYSRTDCSSGLVCNTDKRLCEEPTKVEQIMNKQDCPNIVKNTCFTDTDCACDGGDYVCDKDNAHVRKGECIKRKQFITKKDGEKCTTTKECDFMSVCDGVCMPDKDILALLMSISMGGPVNDKKTWTHKNVYYEKKRSSSSRFSPRRGYNKIRQEREWVQPLTNEIDATSRFKKPVNIDRSLFCRTERDCTSYQTNNIYTILQCIHNSCEESITSRNQLRAKKKQE